jgi:hypothetical protein
LGKAASRIAIGAGLVVVLVGVVATVLLGRLGRLIEQGVETAGPKITGTEVGLGSAHVSIFDGEGALKRLRIGNPKGFSDGHAFDLGEIALALDLKSLATDVVRVKHVTVVAPRLAAEFDAGGRSNLNQILSNVRAGRGAAAKAPRGEGGGAQARMIIDEFRFENAELRVLAPAYGLDKTVKLAPVVLKNLGAKQGGAAAADLADQVMRPVVEAALRAALKEYLAAQRARLGDKAKEGLLDRMFQ